MTIYLNASSHGLPASNTCVRMARHTAEEARLGTYTAALAVADEVAGIRLLAAHLLGAMPERTGFSATTTDAWLRIVAQLELHGRRVLVAAHEWGDNVRMLRRLGARVEVIRGRTPADWEARIDDDLAAIFAPMVTSVQGLHYPVAGIGALPRPDGCRFIVDAAQALGRMPVDVGLIGCDALVATGRKWLRGPRGTAIFWLTPGMGVVGDVEPFDSPVAARLGLGAALEDAMRGDVVVTARDLARLRLHGVEAAGRTGLTVLEGGPGGALAIRVNDPARVTAALNTAGIVAKLPDAMRDEPEAPCPGPVVRLSPHIYNTTHEIDRAIAVIANVQ